MKVSTFILATKDEDIINSRSVRELFKYFIRDEEELRGYYNCLFGDYIEINEFEQGLYNEILDYLIEGYTVIATIDTEEHSRDYSRIVELMGRSGIHVINSSEI